MKQSDKRWRVRAPKQFGPVWPLAFELALAGSPIACMLVTIRDSDMVAAVALDANGELHELRRLRRSRIVRWCLLRNLRVHRTLEELVCAVMSGRCAGWVHGVIVEHDKGRQFLAPSVPFDFTLAGEHPRAGAPHFDPSETFSDEEAGCDDDCGDDRIGCSRVSIGTARVQ